VAHLTDATLTEPPERQEDGATRDPNLSVKNLAFIGGVI